MAGAVTAQKKLRHCKRVEVGPHWQILALAVASAATNKATTESSANLGFCHSSPAFLTLCKSSQKCSAEFLDNIYTTVICKKQFA